MVSIFVLVAISTKALAFKRQQTITSNIVEQRRSDFYIIFNMILCDTDFFVW